MTLLLLIQFLLMLAAAVFISAASAVFCAVTGKKYPTLKTLYYFSTAITFGIILIFYAIMIIPLMSNPALLHKDLFWCIILSAFIFFALFAAFTAMHLSGRLKKLRFSLTAFFLFSIINSITCYIAVIGLLDMGLG